MTGSRCGAGWAVRSWARVVVVHLPRASRWRVRIRYSRCSSSLNARVRASFPSAQIGAIASSLIGSVSLRARILTRAPSAAFDRLGSRIVTLLIIVYGFAASWAARAILGKDLLVRANSGLFTV